MGTRIWTNVVRHNATNTLTNTKRQDLEPLLHNSSSRSWRKHVHSFRESPVITSGHNSFQMNDIGMVELAHDAGLAQKLPPLLLRVAHF